MMCCKLFPLRMYVAVRFVIHITLLRSWWRRTMSLVPFFVLNHHHSTRVVVVVVERNEDSEQPYSASSLVVLSIVSRAALFHARAVVDAIMAISFRKENVIVSRSLKYGSALET